MGRIPVSRAAFSSAALVASLALGRAPATGAPTTVQIPGAYTLDFSGTVLSLTNTFVDTSTTAPRPAALGVTASGTRGIGLIGVSPALYGLAVVAEASGTSSAAFDGIESGTGSAGQFVLEGTSANAVSTAVSARDSGGSTARGAYGNAGAFAVTNTHNTMPAVTVTTGGIDSYALQVVNSGFSDGAVTYQPSGNNGGIAGYFEINSANAQFGQTALLAVHSGGEKTMGSNGRYGNAGRFVITNTNNFDSAVVALTRSDQGTGLEGDDFSGTGGVAVLGQSTAGDSAQFTGGSGGSGTCTYDGGPGWNCPSDRNLKDDLVAADTAPVLARLETLPLYYYHMKGSQRATRYLGPTAQDFKAAFGLGDAATKINTANAQGVALAASKALYARLKSDEAKLATQAATLAQLERRLDRLEARR